MACAKAFNVGASTRRSEAFCNPGHSRRKRAPRIPGFPGEESSRKATRLRASPARRMSRVSAERMDKERFEPPEGGLRSEAAFEALGLAVGE